MSLVVLAAIPVAAWILSVKTGRSGFDTLPLVTGCSILLLYILAFFHALHAAGLMACGIVVLLAGWLVRRPTDAGHACGEAADESRGYEATGGPQGRDAAQTARRRILSALRTSLHAPGAAQMLFALAIMAAVGILTAGRVVTWWDDLNFWANDAKFLWYMGGFAGKYGNVSPSFGDYPPATSLWKWIFLSLSPREYQEGLQFSAYYILNMIFLLPVLQSTRTWSSRIARFIAVPALFLIPGGLSGLQFAGSAADVTMGCVYGALLLALAESTCTSRASGWGRTDDPRAKGAMGAILSESRREELFRVFRIAVYGSVLVLTKFTGIQWLMCAFLFWLLVCRPIRKSAAVLFAAGVPLAVWGSWMLFCLVNRRVAKLTGEAVRMARGQFPIAPDAAERLRVFLEAFFLRPLHEDRNLTLDLTAAAVFVTVIITCVIIKKWRILLFELISAILAYGTILLMHLTLFRTEEQYLNAFDMARSISRYGAPWTIAVCILAMDALARTASHAQSVDTRLADSSGHSMPDPDPAPEMAMTAPASAVSVARARILACAGFLLLPILTADYIGEARAFWTWRQTVNEDLAEREEHIDPEGREFLADMEARPDLYGRRILFLRAVSGGHAVRDTYIAYEACPVAVVFESYIPGMSEEEIRDLQDKDHAVAVWVAEQAP